MAGVAFCHKVMQRVVDGCKFCSKIPLFFETKKNKAVEIVISGAIIISIKILKLVQGVGE